MEYKVEVLEKAVKTYGCMHQTVKAAEELSELLVALNKWLGMSENEDYIRDNIREECAEAMEQGMLHTQTTRDMWQNNLVWWICKAVKLLLEERIRERKEQ